jgi:tRNA (guanine26-N2/guanine27-N2)-dimethyltransferase
VFYNGAMALDRDLHVAVASAWSPSGAPRAKAWEMLAATGVRGLRVLGESGAFRTLLSTDAGGPASEVLAANAARYADLGAASLRWDSHRVVPGGPFDAVDLDPFGSPLEFLDAAFDGIALGGLLSVTATDMIVLAGVDAAATRRRYSAEPVTGRLGPEGGLRILLGTLSKQAAGRGRGIHPLVSYVHDHYVRAYAIVVAEKTESEVGVITADRWSGPTLLASGPAGPMWLGPLFDREFVERLRVPSSAALPEELARLLGRFRDEATADVPFYYEPNTVAREAGLPAPPSTERFLAALRAAGFAAARTHARDGALRTRATRAEVLGTARRLVEEATGPAAAPPEGRT